MITSLALTLVLSQSYVRSRMTEGDTSTQCLWWKEQTVIGWRANAAGNEETPGDTEFTAIAAAFEAWNEQLTTCSSLSFVNQGKSPSRVAEYRTARGATNENLVLFREKSCTTAAPKGDGCFSDGSCGNEYDCWQFTAGAIAITTTSYSPTTGQVLDSDVELNTPSYMFTTVDSPPCVRGALSVNCVATDIRNTMTHEIGHLLGLAHISDPTSTMAPSASTGETSKRTIDPGSKRFVCDVYGPGQASKLCFIPRLTVEEGKLATTTGCSAVGAPFLIGLAIWLRRRR